MNLLNLLIKPSSSLCNIACSYCFYLDTAAHRTVSSFGQMSEATVQRLVEQAFAFGGGVHFGFQGGEPLLSGMEFYRFFHKSVEQFNKAGAPVSFSLQTNGMLLTKEWADFFLEYNYLLGVSFDGLPETHDAFRKGHGGEATSEEVLRGIHILQKAGVEFNILTVVSSLAAQRGREIYRYYQDEGFRYLQFIPCLELCGGTKNFSLDGEAYGRFLNDIFPFYRDGLLSGNYVSIRYFDNLVGAFMGRAFESCDMQGRCSVNPTIEADGSVYPCDFYANELHCLGNINSDDFSTILSSPRGREFMEASVSLGEDCRHCPYIALCRGGGCRRQNEGAPSGWGRPRLCKAYLAFFGAHWEDLRRLAGFAFQKQ